MPKMNLRNLALKAIKTKKQLQTKEAQLRTLNDELISRAEGSTLSTELGLVIVTEQTFDREDKGFVISFDETAFFNLPPEMQLELTKRGVVITQKKVIRGQAPRVQYRFNSNG